MVASENPEMIEWRRHLFAIEVLDPDEEDYNGAIHDYGYALYK